MKYIDREEMTENLGICRASGRVEGLLKRVLEV
jgi:hypothetical protein